MMEHSEVHLSMPAESINERLRQFRESRKLSLLIMAHALGVNKEYLALVEQGLKPVKPALLDKLQRAFGANV
ncbi:MAG: helix-turn-helix transcriptional regulator [Burkholderiaceae bacterium]|jgi:transcriptional regulator with XRE-family HTH domain|nr:helix-turn-helix transcriptional regulator [Burkholderiaceae bacterium]